MGSPWEILDNASWTREHWKLFTIVSLTFFLDGILFTIVPAIMYLVEPEMATFIFAVNIAFFALGGFLLGRLADLYGRRVMLIIAITIYTIAAFLLVPFHGSFLELLILTSAINFGIGGEIGAAYSAIAELSPARHRGKAIMLSANMWNVGAALIAGLSLYYRSIYEDINIQINSVILTSAILAAIIAIARLHLPESPRWLVQHRRYGEAIEVIRRVVGSKIDLHISGESLEKAMESFRGVGLREAISRYRFRLSILIAITASQYTTYNMVAYYAPYASGFAYGIEVAPLNIAIANIGASLGAFLLIPLMDRSRKISTLLSYLGGAISAVGLAAIHGILPLAMFLIVVFINMIFSEWAWASLSALESELFPTGVRASTIGFITLITNLSIIAVVIYETYISAHLFLLLASVIWAIGLVASLAWYLRGIETARKSVEELAKI
ncbi:MAG: MFS transporter [Sulfolobales archaeon]